MDGLLILLGLVVVAIPFAVIALMIGHGRLRHRIEGLEREIARLQRPVAVQAAPVERAPDASTDLVPAEILRAVLPQMGPWTPPDDTRDPAQPAAAPRLPRPDRIALLLNWLKANWVYAVSALSLALAGIFFVQYGMERGLLPPPLRVLAGLMFGAALIGGGEYIRRRYSDTEGDTAFLPSTFSGAGLVSMFAAILAARQMYGLIGSEAALAGLVAVALGAVVLGWFHGPFLAAVGLVGASVAPFVTGGDAASVTLLYPYFALIAALGLAVDTLRRWAWVSVLALVLPVLGGMLLYMIDGDAVAFAALLVALVVMAIAIPERSLRPAQQGETTFGALLHKRAPSFPQQLAAGMLVVAVGVITLLQTRNAMEDMLLLAGLAGLMLMISLWAARAKALADLAMVALAGFFLRLLISNPQNAPLWRGFQDAAVALRAPETAAPLTMTIILAMAAVMAAAAAWRSLRGQDHPIYWAALAVITPPATLAALEAAWTPAAVIGAYPWALQAMVLAAGMVALALAFARADGADHRRVAYATLAALVLITFGLFAMLAEAALTIALAALVLAAVVLDRRFKLPELGVFVQVGVIILGSRLTIDPGLGWGIDAALTPVVLAYGGAIAGLAAAWWLLRDMNRKTAQVFVESGLAAVTAVFADVMIFRWLIRDMPDDMISHWAATLTALPWLVLALVQLYRMQLGGWMTIVRRVIATVAAMAAASGIGTAVLPLNPFVTGKIIQGPWLLDTLAVAYALPALLILAALWVVRVSTRLRAALVSIAAGLLAVYGVLEIRRFWRGDDLSAYGFGQGELYSYTIALMLTGAGLLYRAVATGSPQLRRAGMAVIALTVAKVFLVDISGLTGLTRVASFLALGLSLAGLAWLNRWAMARQGGA